MIINPNILPNAPPQRNGVEATRFDKRAYLAQVIRDFAILPDVDSDGDLPQLGPGKWRIDLRAITLTPDVLEAISTIFWDVFSTHAPCQIAGLELGSVPLVAAILLKARQLGIQSNGLIIRKSRNKSGLHKLIEGTPNHDPVIVVDDILHSGLSFDRVRLELSAADLKIAAGFVVIDFQSPTGLVWRQEAGIEVRSIFSLADFDLPLSNTDRLSSRPVGRFEEVWIYRHPEILDLGSVTARSSPLVSDGSVMFGTSSGAFVCLSSTDGAIRWIRETDAPSHKGIRSSPSAANGVVYFGAYDGAVYALSVSTGQTIWRSACAEYIGSSPAIADGLGLLFVGLEHEMPGRRGGIAALDLKSGDVIWEVAAENYLHGTPVYCRKRNIVIVGTNDEEIICLDAKDGVVKWRQKIGGAATMAPALDIESDSVYIGALDGGLYCLSIDDGSQKFVQWAQSAIQTVPLLASGRVFYTSTDKYCYVIDAASGECVARLRSRARSFSSPELIDGGIVFGNNAGLIFDIDPCSLTLRARHQLSDRVASKIAYDPDTALYYVHTLEDRLVALRRCDADAEVT